MTCSFVMETPLGMIEIIEEDGALVSILLSSSLPPSPPSSALGKEISRQIQEYFEKKRSSFSLPISPKGTAFQRKVWEETLKIPYGQYLSYGDIGERIGSKAYRAIGQALGKNPIPIVIPCHRVRSKNGLGGYSGGLEIKKILISLEEE